MLHIFAQGIIEPQNLYLVQLIIAVQLMFGQWDVSWQKWFLVSHYSQVNLQLTS